MTQTPDAVDLGATLTYTDEVGTTHTVQVQVRDRVRSGLRLISVSGLAALLPDELAAIDPTLRAQAVFELGQTRIVLCAEPRDLLAGGFAIGSRDGRVTIANPPRRIPQAALIALGERLHDQLL
ncbi:hypothetical protein EDD29_0036 [Actinocorallia herbida]|uniref:Uncharacterized protein n=1 Tax=Actinocorallia herbida TaxID=58109 RepID=A0A3N1CML5_9ACTN|nr:hypothetical protein [Actinocorallia herbida]ROO82556.1 hypothetical protein EDD29_0036 [Actinocorallia herbida]